MSKSKSKSKTTLKKVARKVALLEQDIESKKAYVGNGTYSALDYTGDNIMIGNLVQGTDASNRTGREIKPTHLRFMAMIRGAQNFTTLNNPVPYRIIIVQDRAYNGTVRPLSQILDTTLPAIGSNNIYMASYNYDYVRGKGDKQNPVTILKDKVGFLNPVASGYGKNNQIIRLNISGKYLSKISYKGGLLSDNTAGTIFAYMLMGSSVTVADNNQYTYRYDLYFKDG